jgi:hypothetical protein
VTPARASAIITPLNVFCMLCSLLIVGRHGNAAAPFPARYFIGFMPCLQ